MQYGVSGSLPRRVPGIGASPAVCELGCEAADRYLDRVSTLVAAAHLNECFPPTGALLGHLSALHSRIHGGLYKRLRIDASSGLPSEQEWSRVQTDLALALSILPRLPTPVVLDKQTRDADFGEQLLKLLYCARLPELGLLPLSSTQVELCRLDPDTGSAHARLVIDRIDGKGLPSRCTIELTETPQETDTTPLLLRVGDGLALSKVRQAALLRLAAGDAESTFIALSNLPGVVVQRVACGTVGPFCLAELPPAIPFSAMISSPAGALATFALEVAARDVTHDGSSDPLAHLLLPALPDESQASREQSRVRLGYRVHRDRKFVVDLASQPALEGMCRAAGTRNIIYPAALSRPYLEVAS
jgi:hypothetical protein